MLALLEPGEGWLALIEEDDLSVEDRAGRQPGEAGEFRVSVEDLDVSAVQEPQAPGLDIGEAPRTVPLRFEEVAVRVERLDGAASA